MLHAKQLIVGSIKIFGLIGFSICREKCCILTLLGERWAASVNLCWLVVDCVWRELLLAFVNNCRICCDGCCVWDIDCDWFGKKVVAVRNCWGRLFATLVVVVVVTLSE